jgi:cytochrome c55X
MYSRSLIVSYLFGLLASLIVLQALGAPLPSRQAELEHMLRHDCGSCHGMTLKGGLGPALTPDALHNKPRAYIQQSIRYGHPGTPMPPWEGLLSLEDIDYLVDLLMTQAKPS